MALGMEGLEVGHRLDQWTTGVVVMSRNKDANKVFKRSLQDREAGLVKTYKALSYVPVPLGPLEHHMYDGPFNEGTPVLGGGNLRARGPRLLSDTAHEGWLACRLTVKECKEHTGALAWHRQHFPSTDDAKVLREPHDSDRQRPEQQQQQQQQEQPHSDQARQGFQVPALSRQPSAVPQPARLYESTIDLHTGRTHQIRAQLASIGCPLVGDDMYTPLTGLLVGESGVLRDPAIVELVEGMAMTEGHIGLHAWQLCWRGHTFTAPPEWGDE